MMNCKWMWTRGGMVQHAQGGWVRAVDAEAERAGLLESLRAAVERMEAVASGIPVENRHKGVSQRTHVQHMAVHLAEHAKKARATLAKAEGGAA